MSDKSPPKARDHDTTVLDTNACLYYAIRSHPQRNWKSFSLSVTNYADSTLPIHLIAIPELVRQEFNNSAKSLLGKDITKLTGAQSRFDLLCAGNLIQDSAILKTRVLNMYQTIWNDPDKSGKVLRWRKRKFKNWSQRNRSLIRQNPSIEFTAAEYPEGPPVGNDLMILSTAANLARSRPVCLLTFDNDFIVFRDEISDVFNVEILSGYDLP